jgi:hypothetical protein
LSVELPAYLPAILTASPTSFSLRSSIVVAFSYTLSSSPLLRSSSVGASRSSVMYGDYDQIQADEELARRLQEDEGAVALGHGIPGPLLGGPPRSSSNNNNNNNVNDNNDVFERDEHGNRVNRGGRGRQVQHHAASNLNEARNNSPRVLWMYISWALLESLTVISILAMAWQDVRFQSKCVA